MTAPRELDILLFEAGSWLVGVEADTIRDVAMAPSTHSIPLVSRLLGGEPSDDDADTRHRRVFSVVRGDVGRRVIVDSIIGTTTVSVREFQAVPGALRNFDIPAWVVGLMWRDGRVVFLLDLFAALDHEDVA